MTKNKKIKETVKIDGNLLERVYQIVKHKDKKIEYSSAKQFINIAVLKLLRKEEKDILEHD